MFERFKGMCREFKDSAEESYEVIRKEPELFRATAMFGFSLGMVTAIVIMRPPPRGSIIVTPDVLTNLVDKDTIATYRSGSQLFVLAPVKES